MASKRDFQVDRRVAIAIDAMTPSQKAALQPVLHDKQRFIAHASRTGMSRKISDTKPLYQMNAGKGLRVFYSQVDGNIVVLDVMRKTTMDRFATKKSKGRSLKKGAGKASVKRD